MSGGVDSSVAAYLLKEKGYDVIGITMQTWSEEEDRVSQGKAMTADAEKVAKALGIMHHVIDVREEFFNHVITPFVESYCHGRTPNPCVICNRMVK